MKDFEEAILNSRRIGIVGSRGYPVMTDVRIIVNKIYKLNPSVIIVSGGARGIDREAEKWADYFGFQKIIFTPQVDKFGKKAYYLRNKKIVDNSDMIIGLWDMQSKGTKMTIDLAITAQKPTYLFGKNF